MVCGGGPAGCAAAVQAARLGLRTLLLESTANLGGMGTSAYVSQWSHCANGEHPVIGGFILELIEDLFRRGHLQPGVTEERWTRDYNRGFGFDPEALKRLLDEKCLDAGVEIRFFSRIVDAEVDPKQKTIQGLITHDVEGLRFIPARTVIDATGDAVVADAAAIPYEQAGRETQHIMPPTLCGLVGDVDFTSFDRRRDQEAALEKALDENFFSQPDRHVPGLFRAGETHGTLNAGHLFKTDAVSTQSLSQALIKGRKLAEEYTDFHRNYLSGCEKARLLTTGHLLGVRESRRVVGEYSLNIDDYLARRTFPDQIAIYCKQVDIHVYDLSEEEYQRYHEEFNNPKRLLQPGEYFGVPYRILVPQGWKNLWVAGRCASTDVKVNGSLRDQPACSMMGQAAGAAAFLALRDKQDAPSLDTEHLRKLLREHQANLP
ncbi:MAG: FAD-dependent oxidoreductase [Opitutales bacterium]|nr:FAD-dependent oxidoreductase [Opitutales bacterium]